MCCAAYHTPISDLRCVPRQGHRDCDETRADAYICRCVRLLQSATAGILSCDTPVSNVHQRVMRVHPRCCAPQGNADKVVAKLKQDWWEMCQANWVLWIPAQFVNFRFVPPNLQARLCCGGQFT